MTVQNNNSISDLFDSMEPYNYSYQSLKNLLKDFVDSMDTTSYQYIVYPQKDSPIAY